MVAMVAEIMRMAVKVVIEDLNLYETKTVIVQLNQSQDEMSYVQGMAAGMQAYLSRNVNVDYLNRVWYITIEDAIEEDED
jgi:hypothetical protein